MKRNFQGLHLIERKNSLKKTNEKNKSRLFISFNWSFKSEVIKQELVI